MYVHMPMGGISHGAEENVLLKWVSFREVSLHISTSTKSCTEQYG